MSVYGLSTTKEGRGSNSERINFVAELRLYFTGGENKILFSKLSLPIK
jgi:hypothetical protein